MIALINQKICALIALTTGQDSVTANEPFTQNSQIRFSRKSYIEKLSYKTSQTNLPSERCAA